VAENLLELARNMDSLKKLPTKPKYEIIEEAEIEIETDVHSIWHLPLKHKFSTLICLLSLVSFMVPHQTYASEVPQKQASGPLIFVIGSPITFLDKLNNLQLNRLYEKKQMRKKSTNSLNSIKN